MTVPRLRPFDPDTLDAEQRAAVDEAVAGRRGRVPAPMRAWLASPELARRAQALGEVARYGTTLPPRLSELAILVTARFWDSAYEWHVHAPEALRGGLAPEVVQAIERGDRPTTAASDELLVHDVSRAVLTEHGLDDDLFAAAIDTLGDRGVAELIGILGYYCLVSMTLNVFLIDKPQQPGIEEIS